MAASLERTFRVLATSANANSFEVLLSALDSPKEIIRELAVQTLLKRPSTRGYLELIRRVDALSKSSLELLFATGPRFESVLRTCLQNGDEVLKRNSLKIAPQCDAYETLIELFQMVEQRTGTPEPEVMATIGTLVDQFSSAIYVGGENPRIARLQSELPTLRPKILAALEEKIAKFDSLQMGRYFVEWMLALGDAESFPVRKMLSQSSPNCREAAGQVMMESQNLGVFQFIFHSLSQNYPHAKAMEAICKRRDMEFFLAFLRWFPARLNPNQQKSLKQIDRVDWLASETAGWKEIPGELQPALVSFLSATRISIDLKIQIQEWLVRNGTSAGRLAAAGVLTSLDSESVETIVFEGLESSDEEIQAWATGQIRAQNINQGFRLLVERLDSALPAVREAARKELEGFKLEIVLNMYAALDADLLPQLGELLRKTDPNCINLLRAELDSPIRRHRIRAAQAAVSLGFLHEVEPILIGMLHDPDSLIRRTAAESLNGYATSESLAALMEVAEDSSPKVRAAVRNSLDAIDSSLRGKQFAAMKKTTLASSSPGESDS